MPAPEVSTLVLAQPRSAAPAHKSARSVSRAFKCAGSWVLDVSQIEGSVPETVVEKLLPRNELASDAPVTSVWPRLKLVGAEVLEDDCQLSACQAPLLESLDCRAVVMGDMDIIPASVRFKCSSLTMRLAGALVQKRLHDIR